MKDNLKLILLVLLLTFALGLFVHTAVQGAENIATQGGSLIFPIAALGNCQNYTTCKAFCDQPQNHAACQSFAQSHRIHPTTATPSASLTTEKYLADAKTILGCTSYDACKTFCQKTENHTKCSEFSQRERNLYYRSNTTQSSSLSTLLFQAAGKELGCTNDESCKSVCSQTQNYQKCSLFITTHRLGPIQNPPTPLPTERPVYPTASPSAKPPTSTNPETWGAPKDVCTTTESCYTYCYNHPTACPTFPYGRVNTNGVPPSYTTQTHQ